MKEVFLNLHKKFDDTFRLNVWDKDVLDILCLVFFGLALFVAPPLIFSVFFSVSKFWMILFALYCFALPKLFLKYFVRDGKNEAS